MRALEEIISVGIEIQSRTHLELNHVVCRDLTGPR